MRMIYFFCTYDHNAEVQNGPHTGEIFSETQRYPLEQHLKNKYSSKQYV